MSIVATLKEARAAAQSLRELYPVKDGLSTDVRAIANRIGITIVEGKIEVPNKKSVSGLIKLNGREGRPVIAVAQDQSEERKRFTIAHEIGHFILHRTRMVHVDTDEVTAFRDSISSTATDPNEMQANQFAAELLMPTNEVKNRINIGLAVGEEMIDIIRALSVTYRVSTLAVTIRVTSLIDKE